MFLKWHSLVARWNARSSEETEQTRKRQRKASDFQIEMIWPHLCMIFPLSSTFVVVAVAVKNAQLISKCRLPLHCCVRWLNGHHIQWKTLFRIKVRARPLFFLSFTEAHQWATTFSFYIFIIVSSSAHQAATAKAITVASRLVFLLEFSFLCHPFVLMCSRAMQHSCSVYCCCAWFFLSFLSFFCSFTSLFIFILHLRLFHPSSSSSSSSFGRFDEPLFQRVPLSMDKNLALLEWRCVQAFLCMCFYVVLSSCLCTISYVLYIL